MVDQARQVERAPGWGMSMLAGAGAGIVAAAAAVGLEALVGARLPPRASTAWSSFVAGLAGGALYAVLARTGRRPVPTLWGISLAIATIDSLLIAGLPMPAGRGPRTWIPIVGLVVPLRQLGALVGLGHFGSERFPVAYLWVATAVHYITAVAVSLLVPWWAGARRR